MRVSSPKTTTENCMDYPVWNELFTFSTGFSTVFVKKRRSFQRCFPHFPHSFPHPVEESPIQVVMDAAAFWKFVGKNVGNLPFIKRKSKVFLLFLQFTPAYGFAFLNLEFPPGQFSKNLRGENPVWKTDKTVVFHTVFIRRRGGKLPPRPLSPAQDSPHTVTYGDIFPQKSFLSGRAKP